MEEYYLDGEKYYYRKGSWLDSSYSKVPQAIVGKLNKLKINGTDLESKSMKELLKIIDDARNFDNIQFAAQALEVAIRKATIKETRFLLPRLTSNYRKLGKPQTAIDIGKSYIDEYGNTVCSTALYTSIAAAYCDLENYSTAREFANRAKALSGRNASPELISVYKRIKEAEN